MGIFKKRWKSNMKTLCFLMALVSILCAQTFQVYTEQLPPFNYMQEGKVDGSSTLLLKQLLEKSGHKIADNKILLGPWARGYNEVLTTPNTILYSMARTQERESLFKWVGPINKLTIGLIAKKEKKIGISKPSDLCNYKIAAMHDTAAESLLLDLGMQSLNLERFSNPTSQLKKLQENRVDAMAFGIESMYAMLKNAGLNPDSYEVVYTLKESELYFAFHKGTSDLIISELNEVLKKIK